MNGLLWLLFGILIGWLAEFVLDYFFWQPRYSGLSEDLSQALASVEDLGTRAATAESNFQTINTKHTDLNLTYNELKTKWRGMDDQVEEARSKNISLTKNIEVLEGRVDTWGRKIGLLTGAGGLIGALGVAFSADDDGGMRTQIGALNGELKTKSATESELGEMRTRLATINHELETAKSGQQQMSGQIQTDLQGKVKSYENDIVQLRGDLQRAQATNGQLSTQIGGWRKRLSLLSGAGALAGLGPILMSDDSDEQRIVNRLRDFNSQLEDKASAGKDSENDNIRSSFNMLRDKHEALLVEYERLLTQVNPTLAVTEIVQPEITGKDPLHEIDGIGPAYEKRLNAGGLFTFAQLVEAGPQRLREIVSPEQWQTIDTEDWIVQAANRQNQ